jgi:hypothetical protein
MSFRGLKKGDTVLRILAPSPAWPASIWEAEVIENDGKVVTCQVIVDGPRTMKFSANTGATVFEELEYARDFIIKDLRKTT